MDDGRAREMTQGKMRAKRRQKDIRDQSGDNESRGRGERRPECWTLKEQDVDDKEIERTHQRQDTAKESADSSKSGWPGDTLLVSSKKNKYQAQLEV